MPKRLTPRGEAAPPVEPIVTGATLPPKTPKKKSSKPEVAAGPGVTYIRNLHHIPAYVRLTSGREVKLAPRGQREDINIVSEDEQSDPNFLANYGTIFEVISAEAAKEAISKQQTNTNERQSSLWEHLRNAQDKPYEQRRVQIEEAFERQGVVVGQVEETGAGRFTDKNFEVTRPIGPEIASVPGSPGHPATEYMQSVPASVSPEEYSEFLAFKAWKDAQEDSK